MCCAFSFVLWGCGGVANVCIALHMWCAEHCTCGALHIAHVQLIAFCVCEWLISSAFCLGRGAGRPLFGRRGEAWRLPRTTSRLLCFRRTSDNSLGRHGCVSSRRECPAIKRTLRRTGSWRRKFLLASAGSKVQFGDELRRMWWKTAEPPECYWENAPEMWTSLLHQRGWLDDWGWLKIPTYLTRPRHKFSWRELGSRTPIHGTRSREPTPPSRAWRSIW